MGSGDGGTWTLRLHAEPLAYGGEVKAQGADISPSCDYDKWTSLGKFVDILRVAELEIKTTILKHLCYFLSSSAATFKYPSPSSAEDISLSAAVGGREVNIKYDDLVALHDFLFRELTRHIPLFCVESENFGDNRNALPSTLQELRATSLILRCCIRLLPLMELFDTGLRKAMGLGLNSLLQNLCSPKEPCLLSRKTELSTCNVEHHRASVLCALLEVFVDELSCRSKSQLLLVEDGSLEKGTRNTSRLTLEATVAHVMISAHASKELHELRGRACELSLQSAVMLLDRVITDNMPRYLLSHVVRIVSQALQDSTCTAEESNSSVKVERRKKWFSRFPISDYFENAESCKVDTNIFPDSLSWQVRFWLVSSVLERGVSLYMKFASAPHLAGFVSTSDDGLQPSAAVPNTLLASCLWNYVCYRGRMSQECEAALESMLNDATSRKGFEECMDQTYRQDHGHLQGHKARQEIHRVLKAVYSNGNLERASGTDFYGRELLNAPIWEDDHSTLIVDVLHLMHSALNFMIERSQSMGKIIQERLTADTSREDIDDIWLGLIGSFHQCLPSGWEITDAYSVGHVLVFFTDMLYYEAESSISVSKLQEYLSLLESLLISLLMEHTWRESTSLSQHGIVDVNFRMGESNDSRTSLSFHARNVVCLLQGFLEEPKLLEILGDNAVSIVLQINCFLNDFCELMDNVLSTNAWREYIPASGRRLTMKGSKTVQGEVDIVDKQKFRNVGEENLNDAMQPCEEQPSLDEERETAEPHPCPTNVEEHQSLDEVEHAEHQPCPTNVEEQQSLDEVEHAEHQSCSTNLGSEKQQLRPSTLPILHRLMKNRSRPTNPRDASPERNPPTENKTGIREDRPIRKCRQLEVAEDEALDIPSEANGNQFVAEVRLLEKTSSKENFDDLNDFIVCKQGRSYTKWLNGRTKFRRRKRTREIWKRCEEKQKLLSMLNIV